MKKIITLAGIIIIGGAFIVNAAPTGDVTIGKTTYTRAEYNIERADIQSKMATHLTGLETKSPTMGRNEFSRWVDFLNNELKECGVPASIKNIGTINATELIKRANTFMDISC